MNLIIEGPDNSGKSTLTKRIQEKLAWLIKDTEGPEKYPGEINDRVGRYLLLDRVIIDRHPCVSQMIYGPFRNGTPIHKHLLLRFWDSRPLIVYCMAPPNSDPTGNSQKAYDTPDHQSLVKGNDANIKAAYDQWAHDHAHIYYRWWSNSQDIPTLVSSYFNYGSRS